MTKKNTREESLAETLARGMKQGGLKKTADKQLAKATAPVAEKLKGMIHKIHPDGKITDKGVDAATNAIALLGIAELLQASATLFENIPGLKNIASKEKVDAIARWSRAHSGETLGQKSSDALFALTPHLVNAIQSPELKALLSDDAEAEASVPARLSVSED